MSPRTAEDVLGTQWWADLTRVCPRLGAIDRGGAGLAGPLLVKVVTVQCFSLVCEHPSQLKAMPSADLSRLRSMCERLLPWMEGRMREETWTYRFACPEVFEAWSRRPWTPSNYLGFYAEVFPCLEKICMDDEGSGMEVRVWCGTASTLAESFENRQAMPRLQERARAAQERGDREMQGLSPAEREDAEFKQSQKAFMRRFRVMCSKGNLRYCKTVEAYCKEEGLPPDICPSPGSTPAGQDAGAR